MLSNTIRQLDQRQGNDSSPVTTRATNDPHSVCSPSPAIAAIGQLTDSHRKPKNARSKRALNARAPKLVEGQKTTLLLRGSSASETIQSVLGDLHALKKPAAVKFTKKNGGIHPFEDGDGGASALEFFSRKNDASLLVLASHSKKRPHNLTLARTFDHRLLDLHEFGVDPATYAALVRFHAVEKPQVGCKPMLLFIGDGWEHDARMRAVKALWMDFFRGVPVDSVDVEGLQYVLSFTAAPETADGGDGAGECRMHLRGHMIRTRRSGQKLPRVEVEETGPRIDLTLRRVQDASDEMLKEALKTPRKQLVRPLS